MTTIRGTYNDGRHAKSHAVSARFGDDILTIIDDISGQVMATWVLSDIHLVGDPTDGQARRLRHGTGDDRLSLEPSQSLTPFEAACANLRRIHLHERRKGRSSMVIWAAGAVASVLLLVFVVIPQTADIIAKRIPQAWEDKLGENSARQIMSLLAHIENKDVDKIMCSNPDAMDLIHQIAARLSVSGPVSVQILDLDMANAFAIPGNRVFVLKGLIDNAESPAEVIGVLAHEIGHVHHRHPLSLLLKTTGTSLLFGLVFGDLFGGSLIAGLSQTLVSSAYTRDAETEADDWALARTNALDMDVRALSEFFDRMHQEQGSAEQTMRYFSTHPTSKDRASAVRAQAQGTQPALTDKQWQILKTACQ